MADTSNPKESLRRLTQQKFQEEVARELGIDLNSATLPHRDAQNLEHDVHEEDTDQANPS